MTKLFLLTIKALKYFRINHREQSVFFNWKSSSMSQLDLSDSYEYLCHGSTPIVSNLFFQCRNRL